MFGDRNRAIIYPLTKIIFEAFLELKFASMLNVIAVYFTPGVPVLSWFYKPEDAFCSIVSTAICIFCFMFPHIVWRLLILDNGR